DLKSSPYRWKLKSSDTRSLYRQYNRMEGVSVTYAAHENIHRWLSPDSPQYNIHLANAIFHYSPRIQKEDRFEICIATEEMREAAWQYGHSSQILLDGTFGICVKKMLLFIVMGLNKERKGIPLAFFLFSAPTGNNQMSGGYDTEIIEKMLREWKNSLGTRNGQAFEPKVAITDTDLKEWNALVRIFPGISLLICKFHLRQSWRNHRKAAVKGSSPAHADIRARLSRLEEALIHMVIVDDVRAIIAKERTSLQGLLDTTHGGPAEKGLEHLRYLEDYWLREELWQSWSDFGRQHASELLGIPVEGVLTTTNHLESFNGVFKNKYL
ncbi:hypothetical protein OE88DRAFT_1596329, partial [Heliocybe sulcata]